MNGPACPAYPSALARGMNALHPFLWKANPVTGTEGKRGCGLCAILAPFDVRFIEAYYRDQGHWGYMDFQTKNFPSGFISDIRCQRSYIFLHIS